VIAVADDPRSEVFFPVFVKEASAVVVGGFFDPAVEDFIHDEDAHFVAEAEEVRSPRTTKGAAFPMFTDAEEFGDFSIEVKASGRIPFDRANAKAGVDFIDDLIVLFKSGGKRVKSG